MNSALLQNSTVHSSFLGLHWADQPCEEGRCDASIQLCAPLGIRKQFPKPFWHLWEALYDGCPLLGGGAPLQHSSKDLAQAFMPTYKRNLYSDCNVHCPPHSQAAILRPLQYQRTGHWQEGGISYLHECSRHFNHASICRITIFPVLAALPAYTRQGPCLRTIFKCCKSCSKAQSGLTSNPAIGFPTHSNEGHIRGRGLVLHLVISSLCYIRCQGCNC